MGVRDAMSDTPPDVSISPARKMFLSGASIIWFVPLVALLVALGVAWKSYNDRGPLIVIEFEKGTGIKAKETELKFRDITVGTVEKVGFTEGLERVTASVRVDKDVAPFIDTGAIFWIVQPEVSAQGITGLTTVLSGVHIEGSWDEQIGTASFRFQGAAEPPLIHNNRDGLQIAFRTTASGYLTDNAPILYRGIEVGRVGRAKIDPRGGFAIVEALIFEEHRTLVSDSTRFWDASGFTVSIGPAGAEIDFSSLATLVGGGITFDTFVSGGGPVTDGTLFEIFPDEETARNSVFNASEVEPLKVSVIFDDNIAGLVVGAPVELSGLNIGQVDTLAGIVDVDQFGDSRVRLNVIMSIQPARLGLPGDVTAANALNFLQSRVTAGLRARLASGSLLTGGLKIELVDVDGAEGASLPVLSNGLPLMPTTQSDVSDAAATVEGVFNRINSLPIEELLNSAITFLNAAERLVSDEDLRETPQDVRALLADVQNLIGSDNVQNIPVALNATLSRVEALVAELEEQQLAARLVEAIDTVTETAAGVTTSVKGVPDLIEDLRSVAQKADALAVEDLVAEVTSLVNTADALLTSEAVAALPVSLSGAIEQVSTSLTELRDAGTVGAINDTLASVRDAAASVATSTQDLPEITEQVKAALDNVAKSAAGVSASIEGVPGLIEDLRSVAQKADALAVEDLIAEVTTLVDTADKLLKTESVAALPDAMKEAVDQVNASLTELRAAGTVAAITDTLASARTAAANVATTSESLPQITERLNKVLEDAAAATTNINAAAAGVPELIERMQAVAAKAESLEVDELVNELTNLTRSADELISAEDAKALPRALKRALDEVNYTLQTLREGGTVENVNRTLASARNAADTVAVTAQDLPAMVARLNRLFAQASRTIEGYDKGDELNRSAQTTLRDIQKAADALASLARTIERNPNSLLLGR